MQPTALFLKSVPMIRSSSSHLAFSRLPRIKLIIDLSERPGDTYSVLTTVINSHHPIRSAASGSPLHPQPPAIHRGRPSDRGPVASRGNCQELFTSKPWVLFERWVLRERSQGRDLKRFGIPHWSGQVKQRLQFSEAQRISSHTVK